MVNDNFLFFIGTNFRIGSKNSFRIDVVMSKEDASRRKKTYLSIPVAIGDA